MTGGVGSGLGEYGDSLPRVKRETLGEQVAQTLRNLISLDRLKPVAGNPTHSDERRPGPR